MSPVVWWQIDAVRLVVGSDDDAAAIGDGVFGEVLFVHAQYIGRGGGVGFHVVVELESINVAEVACFENPLNRPSIWCGDTSQKFHGPTARLIGSSAVSLPIPCAP